MKNPLQLPCLMGYKAMLFCFFFVLIFNNVYSINQPYLHILESFTSTSYSAISGITTDEEDNVYISGDFSGTITIDNQNYTSSNGSDLFLVKLNSDGIIDWVHVFPSNGAHNITAMKYNDGALYLSGEFTETINFSPTGSASGELTSQGSFDAYIAKYDTTGSFLWARRGGSPQMDRAVNIHVDNSAVYITGWFMGSATFNGSTLQSDIQISSFQGSRDGYVAKYDLQGDLEWVRRMGGNLQDYCQGVTTDENNVYVVGSFRNTANFNTPSIVGSNELVAVGNPDAFLASYSKGGTLNWIKRFGGQGMTTAEDITINDGKLFFTGVTYDTAYFDGAEIISAGDADVFLASYDTTGNLNWVKRAGSSYYCEGKKITSLDSAIYIIGEFTSEVSFLADSIVDLNSASFGTRDVFVAKYDTTGTFIWSKRGGGQGMDDVRALHATKDAVLVTGAFRNEANFNTPSDFSTNTLNTSSSFINSFLWILAECPSPPDIQTEFNECDSISLTEIIHHYNNQNYLWYGDSVSIAPLNPTTSFYDDTVIYVAEKTWGCESQRVPVHIHFHAITASIATDETNFSITALNEGVDYQWLDCNESQIIAGEINPTLDILENGSYAVIVDNQFCVDTSECVVFSTIDTENFSFDGKASKIKVYPNPASQKFFVKVDDDYSMDIYNAQGKLIYQEEVNKGTHPINKPMENGTYFLHFSNAKNVFYERLIISK